jgi:plasmid segregation protein ParM
MYQKIIVPIDHGNRNMKTEHKVFTSGFVEGDCRPALGEYLYYNGRYYALAEQRIPYMRDKTVDDRFFILTLFAVAMEAEKQMLNAQDTILQAVLPVGLPPRSITAHCTGSSRIISGAGASRGSPIRASPIRWG